MTEIEIRDPDPTGGATAGEAPAAEPAPESPYKNLLVPLVVVPALIVMVLVLVVTLFGLVAGKVASPRENLDRLLRGGANERQQAAFNLVQQVLESRQASSEGHAPAWDIDASFLPELRAARGSLAEPKSAREVPMPLVLSSLLAQLGDPEGVEELAALTRLPEELDPAREYRMYAAWTLGALGLEMGEHERALAAKTMIGLLESQDAGLVLVAIAGLQNLPSPETVPALRGMLTSSALEQRASAALSLVALKDDAGAPVLEGALALAPYEEERAADARKWPPQRVSESRGKALEALFALGKPPAREVLERLASQEEPDPKMRTLARARLAEEPAR